MIIIINELKLLSDALKEYKIETYEWHPLYNPVPKNTLTVNLLENGSISRIRTMPDNLTRDCRKYGDNNSSGPCFNIFPLFEIAEDADPSDVEWYLKIRGSFLGKRPPDISIVNVERILRIMQQSHFWQEGAPRVDTTNKCLKKIAELATLSEYPPLKSLADITDKLEASTLWGLLRDYAVENLVSDENMFRTCMRFFPGKDKPVSISIFLDLTTDESVFDEDEKNDIPLAGDISTREINRRLLAKTTKMDDVDYTGGMDDANDTNGNADKEIGKREAEYPDISATKENPEESVSLDVFNNPYVGSSEKMPFVKSGGKSFRLRSMNAEEGQVCQLRYGKGGNDSFPIADSSKQELKTSLEWALDPVREGQTWSDISSSEILLAFPDKLSKSVISSRFAFLLSGSKNAEASFEAEAQRIIDALNIVRPDDRPENMQVFILKQIPPNVSKRTMVAYFRNCSVDKLIDSVDHWSAGCLNLPSVGIQGEIIPYPLRISSIANNIWKRNGDIVQGKAALMKIHQGVDLFLGMPEHEIRRILRGVVNNFSGLFASVGLSRATGKSKATNEKVKNKREKEGGQYTNIEKSLALLGLLLYKLGIRKENYMNTPAYRLGRLLQLMDSLHVEYCEAKRDGKIPPRLIGNATIEVAVKAPVRAFNLVVTRSRPYQAWAKQSGNNLARWLIREMGLLTAGLGEDMEQELLTIHTGFRETEKAQFFIGYMARELKNKNDSDSDNENIENNNIKEEECTSE